MGGYFVKKLPEISLIIVYDEKEAEVNYLPPLDVQIFLKSNFISIVLR